MEGFVDPNTLEDDSSKDSPPGQGESKKARRRRNKRLSVDNKILPETNSESPTNEDVGSIPKPENQSSPSNAPNNKKRDKSKSKFLGLEPTELELKMARSVLVMLQNAMKVPAIPNGSFGVKVFNKEAGEAVFICDLPDNVTIINDRGDIEEVQKPLFWTYARGAKAVSGNIVDRGVDWVEENPVKAGIFSVGLSTFAFITSAMTIKDAIEKNAKAQNAQNNNPAPPPSNKSEENIKVDYVEGVPMPRVD